MVFAWLLARAVRLLLRWLLQLRQLNITQLSVDVMISVSGIVTFLVGILVALATLGVSVTPMLAGLGVAGIILGFALPDFLSNLASGAMILFYQPYDVDDHVCVGGVEGVVKKMNLVARTITTFDNQVLVVPNKNIRGDNIINHTASRSACVELCRIDQPALSPPPISSIVPRVPRGNWPCTAGLDEYYVINFTFRARWRNALGKSFTP